MNALDEAQNSPKSKMMNKQKLTIDAQIAYMKEKGITFEQMNEQDAREFLEKSNCFFKIKAYAKNYEKHNGVYKNLDFAYLVEFSKLDAHLRRVILNLSLSVEHLLKTALNKHFCQNFGEDGYAIAKDFLIENPRMKSTVKGKTESISFIKNLLGKYQNHFALWNLMEVLSFGEFLKLYDFYFEKYPLQNTQKAALFGLFCAHIA